MWSPKLGPDPLRHDADGEAGLDANQQVPQAYWYAADGFRRWIAGSAMCTEANCCIGTASTRYACGTHIDEAEFDAMWTDLVELMKVGFRRGKIVVVRPEDDHGCRRMGPAGHAPMSIAGPGRRAGCAAPRSAPRNWKAATCSGVRPAKSRSERDNRRVELILVASAPSWLLPSRIGVASNQRSSLSSSDSRCRSRRNLKASNWNPRCCCRGAAAAALLGGSGLLVPDVPAQHPTDPGLGGRARRRHRVRRRRYRLLAGAIADVRHGPDFGRGGGTARRRHRGRGRPQTWPTEEGDGDPDGGESGQRRGSALAVLHCGGPGRGSTAFISNPLLLFSYSAVLGPAVGAALGYVTLWIRRRLAHPGLETIQGLVVPFAAFISAEHLHASGVLAVVVAGFVVGHGALDAGYQTRLQERYVLELRRRDARGLVFAYIGLQLRFVLEDLNEAHESLTEVALASGVVLVVVLLIRPAWVFLMFGAACLSRHVEARLSVPIPVVGARGALGTRKPNGGKRSALIDRRLLTWQENVVVSWTGMRGW